MHLLRIFFMMYFRVRQISSFMSWSIWTSNLYWGRRSLLIFMIVQKLKIWRLLLFFAWILKVAFVIFLFILQWLKFLCVIKTLRYFLCRLSGTWLCLKPWKHLWRLWTSIKPSHIHHHSSCKGVLLFLKPWALTRRNMFILHHFTFLLLLVRIFVLIMRCFIKISNVFYLFNDLALIIFAFKVVIRVVLRMSLLFMMPWK
mgnify:CR=1 FL=1